MRDIPIREIDDSDHLLRFRIGPDAGSLLRSMERDGQLTPIRVAADGPGRFKLLDGFRRMRAARRLGWRTIRCLVYPPIPRAEARRIAFLANFIHPQPTPEQVVEMVGLARREGFTAIETAGMLGLTPQAVVSLLASPGASGPRIGSDPDPGPADGLGASELGLS